MSRSFVLALLLALPASAVVMPAASAEPAVTVDPEGGLAIGGVGIVQLRDKSVCVSVRQRSERITARLVEALWKINRKAQFDQISVAVEPPAVEPWIAIEGVPVMKVTTEDVAATGKDAQTLAQQYADAFSRALRRIYTP